MCSPRSCTSLSLHSAHAAPPLPLCAQLMPPPPLPPLSLHSAYASSTHTPLRCAHAPSPLSQLSTHGPPPPCSAHGPPLPPSLQDMLRSLEMPRFTRRYPVVLDTLMRQMLVLVKVRHRTPMSGYQNSAK